MTGWLGRRRKQPLCFPMHADGCTTEWARYVEDYIVCQKNKELKSLARELASCPSRKWFLCCQSTNTLANSLIPIDTSTDVFVFGSNPHGANTAVLSFTKALRSSCKVYVFSLPTNIKYKHRLWEVFRNIYFLMMLYPLLVHTSSYFYSSMVP